MRFIFLIILSCLCLWLLGGFISAHTTYSASEVEFLAVNDKLVAVNRQIKEVKSQIYALDNNPLAIERIAREQYGWCRKGEEIYQFDNTPEWN